jgi:hypothetical protein
MEVISPLTDHVTQLHLVTVEAEGVYQAALTALTDGVPRGPPQAEPLCMAGLLLMRPLPR